jgi:hypothetical protein
MRFPERCVNVTLSFRTLAALGRPLLCCAAASLLSACAPRSCANPYVLDFLNNEDARADVEHVSVLHDPVVTVAGPTPDTLSCSVWEQVRRPSDGRTVLRPQFFGLRSVGEGWKIFGTGTSAGGT